MNDAASFPLITLRPLSDAGNVWTALQLDADPALSHAQLAELVQAHGLLAALDALRCVVIADPARLDLAPLGELPAGKFSIQPAPAPPVARAPTPPSSKIDATGRSVLLKLLSLVTADAETAAIEAVIKRDPNLSYQLLKLVNSVAFSPTQKVTSFSQAIALLGRRQLQRWLQLLLYTRTPGSTVASPLLPRAALRARLMELLVKHLGQSQTAQDEAFMVGMFSLLDALLGVPLQEVVAPLNLPDEVLQALTTGNGQFGALKACVIASESGPSAALTGDLASLGLTPIDWARLLIQAYAWAIQIGKEA